MMAKRLLPLIATLVGCTGSSPGPSEASAEGGDPLGTADGSEAAAPDGEAAARAGPVTHVARQTEMVGDRLCDLDGDGLDDNAIADLGTQSPLFIAAINALFASPEDAYTRWMLHLPHVDDLDRMTDLETVLVPFVGWDTDDPHDASDDFSGEEPFWIRPFSLDACGEPRFSFYDARLDGGELVTPTPRQVLLELTAGSLVAVEETQFRGLFEPSGGEAEWWLCGIVEIGEIGAQAVPEIAAGDLSLLELMLGGGAALGVPTLPGITPDLDLDGDGIERFVLAADGHIASCVDGDLTTIDGADCWLDGRMADGFSVNFYFDTVTARLAGRQAGWEEDVDGSCESPPEESLWAF